MFGIIGKSLLFCLSSQNAKVNRCRFHFLENGLSLLQFFPSFLPIGVGVAFSEDEYQFLGLCCKSHLPPGRYPSIELVVCCDGLLGR